MQFLHNSLVELITQTSTNLPPDVRAAMSAAEAAEKPSTQASQALNIIFSNIDMAEPKIPAQSARTPACRRFTFIRRWA